jgi:hypothetical protein
MATKTIQISRTTECWETAWVEVPENTDVAALSQEELEVLFDKPTFAIEDSDGGQDFEVTEEPMPECFVELLACEAAEEESPNENET